MFRIKDVLLLRTARRCCASIARNLGILSRLNFCVNRRLYGNKVRIPVIKEMGLTNLVASEIWMITILKKFLSIRKGIFFDIGVNLGQSLIKVKCIDPAIEYVGLEPNPTCVYYVKELIKENSFSNCTIIPVGLFNKTAILQLNFFNKAEVDSAASLIENFRPDHKVFHREYVPVFNFNAIASTLDLQDVGIIKIDVEGAELEVLESLREMLSRFRPIVIIEILPVYSVENKMRKKRQDKVEMIIRTLDYNIFRIRKNSRDRYDGLNELETIDIHSDLNKCDYILAPGEVSISI